VSISFSLHCTIFAIPTTEVIFISHQHTLMAHLAPTSPLGHLAPELDADRLDTAGSLKKKDNWTSRRSSWRSFQVLKMHTPQSSIPLWPHCLLPGTSQITAQHVALMTLRLSCILLWPFPREIILLFDVSPSRDVCHGLGHGAQITSP